MRCADPPARSLAVALAVSLAGLPLAACQPRPAAGPALGSAAVSSPWRACRRQGQRHYDVIVFGDEPAGVMTALELARQLPRLAGRRRPRIALLTAAEPRQGLGGTIARAGLAYLDRNQVPRDMRGVLPPFAPSSDLYRRFLALTGVRVIAVDPRRASSALQRALAQARIPVLGPVAIQGTELERSGVGPSRLCVLETARHGRLGADLFLDASLGGELAHRAGVAFLGGIGSGELSQESIALGWIFEVEGLSLSHLRGLEEQIIRRLLDPGDREAQGWLERWPAYAHNRERLLNDLLDGRGAPRVLFATTSDCADQTSPALAIAFHGEEQLPTDLQQGEGRLDAANIAILPDRLSFNALLFRNNAERNRQLLARRGRPLAAMEPVAMAVERFFLRHGARHVHWMPEIYIRSADQIAHPWEPLSAATMAGGGVRRAEALGTFTYSLDFRGGLGVFVPPAKPTFNFGYRHTLPREIGNLAVLGPASGFAGVGEGAGRIIELNISVGQGLAIATALALGQGIPLARVEAEQVAQLMPAGYPPYGRPSGSTALRLLLNQLRYRLDAYLPWQDA